MLQLNTSNKFCDISPGMNIIYIFLSLDVFKPRIFVINTLLNYLAIHVKGDLKFSTLH